METDPAKTPSLTIREFNVVEVDPTLIQDTNGAGDSFAGGFLARIVEGASVEEAVETGHAWAAKVIKRAGFGVD